MAKQAVHATEVYNFFLRTTADGAFVVSPEPRITYMNPAAASLLMVTRDDVIGKHPRECFQENQALLNLFLRSSDQRLDIRLPRQRLASGIGHTLETGERLILLQDITEKRDVENRREALSKSIAHDLRNPISAISGYAELVDRFGRLNDQQHKFLSRIQETSDKLHDMIALLVDLAWIEAGMPLDHVPIRLDEAIERAVREITPDAAQRRITIAVSVQKPLPTVTGDPERMHQAIYHLLHNAVIYSHPESSIVIHAWEDQHEVYCSIADQGIGIAENELELVFDRMYRSRDERVRAIPGGGLGLTVSRIIIQRHGGNIWVSSALDEGSTFTFVLPTLHF